MRRPHHLQNLLRVSVTAWMVTLASAALGETQLASSPSTTARNYGAASVASRESRDLSTLWEL
jgi:hypothetical protein